MQRLARVIGAFVQVTRPRGVRVRDAYLDAIDGTRLQRVLAETVAAPDLRRRRLRDQAGAARHAPDRRLVVPPDRPPRRPAPPGWAAVASDEPSRALLEAEGLPVSDPGADGAWLRSRGLTWALLRPDRFVFACGRPEDVRAGARAWRRVAAPARVEVAA